MAKTPEEIKKGLEKCPNADCSLCLSSFHCDLEADALAYIQQLERERDAAVQDLKEHGMFCSTCLHESKSIREEPCATCSKLTTGNIHSNWQWRGVQEV